MFFNKYIVTILNFVTNMKVFPTSSIQVASFVTTLCHFPCVKGGPSPSRAQICAVGVSRGVPWVFSEVFLFSAFKRPIGLI